MQFWLKNSRLVWGELYRKFLPTIIFIEEIFVLTLTLSRLILNYIIEMGNDGGDIPRRA